MECSSRKAGSTKVYLDIVTPIKPENRNASVGVEARVRVSVRAPRRCSCGCCCVDVTVMDRVGRDEAEKPINGFLHVKCTPIRNDSESALSQLTHAIMVKFNNITWMGGGRWSAGRTM